MTDLMVKRSGLPIETRREDLAVATRMIEASDYKSAMIVLGDYLKGAHRDLDAWFVYGRLMLETDQFPVAWLVYSYILSAGGGDRWQAWANMGRALENLHMHQEAVQCHEHVLEVDPKNVQALISLGVNRVQQYRPDEAIAALERALEIEPDSERAKSTLGYAYLQKREWALGWAYYDYGVGKQAARMERIYTGEPRWRGERARLIVHGEQGIGDQIAGLEPLNRAMQDNEILALEVSPKIAGLVQRSFPSVEVHNTLHETGLDWPARFDGVCTAHTSVFSLHRHYRRCEADYLGMPYLVADPARRIQWRALFDSLGGKLTVGIAWSGGTKATFQTDRHIDLEALTPILRMPVDFVSLEYRDRSEEIEAYEASRGIRIHQYPWGAASHDYDDQAAMVAELDLVICVCTSVVHLAGALGTPVLCMVHESPNIHYSAEGDHLAYYGDRVRLFRREGKDWTSTIAKIADELAGWRVRAVAA